MSTIIMLGALRTGQLGRIGLEIVNEVELVQQCRLGSREAQRELYDRTLSRIHRLLLKMTASPDDALDLTQDTYVKAFLQIPHFDGRSSVGTWLYRIAVNEALQFFRRAARTRVTLQKIDMHRSQPDLFDGSLKLDINEALASVGTTDRAVLLLRYQEGLDYRKIAEVLGCSEGTVASRLNRARHRLREILKEGYAPGEELDVGAHPSNSA